MSPEVNELIDMIDKSQVDEKKVEISDPVKELAEFFPGYDEDEIRKVLEAKPSF